MRSVLAVVATLAITSSSGCFVASDVGDGDGGALHASWSITQGLTASSCQAMSADTVEIVATQRGGSRLYQEFFDCIDNAATIGRVRPGVYDVEVTVYDLAGKALSAPFAVEVRVVSGQVAEAGHFEFNFPAAVPTEGRFSASWAISVDGQVATCAEVGATVFQIVSHGPAGAPQQYTDSTNCADLAALTDPLPAGTYVVSVRLLDADGAVLNAVPIGATLPLPAGQTVKIGDFEFAFTYRSAAFKVHMGDATVAGGNCTPAQPDGGAGVVQEEIVLTRAGVSQCLLTQVAGVYDSSHEMKTTPTCSPFNCQEETVLHSLKRLPNGQYFVQVRGYQAAAGGGNALCYLSSNIPFTVNNGDVDLGTIMAPFNASMDPTRCL